MLSPEPCPHVLSLEWCQKQGRWPQGWYQGSAAAQGAKAELGLEIWHQAASTRSQMHPQPHICSHTGTSTVSATVRARGRWSRDPRVGVNSVLG